jgi:hypothetical protein
LEICAKKGKKARKHNNPVATTEELKRRLAKETNTAVYLSFLEALNSH